LFEADLFSEVRSAHAQPSLTDSPSSAPNDFVSDLGTAGWFQLAVFALVAIEMEDFLSEGLPMPSVSASGG
jgi:hypothetical protein